jgi:hypothetical protein
MKNQTVYIPLLELEDGKKYWNNIRRICKTIGAQSPELSFVADKLPEQRKLLDELIQKIRESDLPESVRNSVVESLGSVVGRMFDQAAALIHAGLPTDIRAMKKVYKAAGTAPNGIARVYAKPGDPASIEIKKV